ncbi:MAG: phage tail sheath family protein [Nostoc sp. CmiVER01]|uniref:phage tail sheath family protein n=1 Tax=Nostoc sp. CmiVER01 TaxID=3075384 RepID=UPI002AD54D9B|nr:phage tail sheath subtilisin-like domain-containing protein [Nostoc sp. CmiVER01]MDZ8124250.1 phage tail sheath subtilisin-like domain-containing protein [Nostoc sp. CmiVER01]
MLKHQSPGVYYKERVQPPEQKLQTGVPVFLGYTTKVPEDNHSNKKFNKPQTLTVWAQFERYFGKPAHNSYLPYAVRGFFQNGGSLCYVVPLQENISPSAALLAGLEAIELLYTIDLVCVPDIMRSLPPGNWTNDPCAPEIEQLPISENLPPDLEIVLTMQSAVLEHCNRLGDRFAILNSLPNANAQQVLHHGERLQEHNAALYYPWIRVQDDSYLKSLLVPPCGHIAGVYARTDQNIGVHKAPANAIVNDVLELQVNLTNNQQGALNIEGINCLRNFPGRGILVWGARTLSHDPDWTYINVRRLFLTIIRWIEWNMLSVVFEPNDAILWNRIGRELSTYFNELFQQGALKGSTAEEAFYVKCDEQTNPPQVRDAGQVVTEIGIAPILPSEFIVVTIFHGKTGISITEVPKFG